MKTKLKAFTLVELIVVIAIFGILMAGLMNFFRPIRGTYVDSTLYEQQRTVHNGILEYLCENTRYAEKIRIYDEGVAAGTYDSSVDSGREAYTAFCKEMIDDSLYEPDDLKDLKYKVHIICINRKDAYDAEGQWKGAISAVSDKDHAFCGRIITNIIDKELDATKVHLKNNTIKWENSFDDTGARTKGPAYVNDMTTFMALGGGYYGAGDYIINIDPAKSSKDGISFGVISQKMDNGNVVKDSHAAGNSALSNDGGYITLETVQSNLMKNPDDLVYYYNKSSQAHGTLTATGSVSGGNKNTWIVFTLPDEGDR